MAALLPIEIANALNRGATILAANQRVARTIDRAFDRSMKEERHELWQRPSVLAVDAWLSSQWHKLLLDGFDARMLLNPVQERALWHDLIAADATSELPQQRSINSLANTAARAWQAVCLHHGRSRVKELGVSIDTRAFERWALEFERTCRRAGYLTFGQLPAALEAALSRGELTIPDAGVSLVDVYELLPSTLHFFESLERAGYRVEQLRAETTAGSAHLLTAPDEEAELRAAARWVREKRDANPAARIALVSPDPAGRQLRLERALRSSKAEEHIHSQRDAIEKAPGYSLRKSLAEAPLAAAALDLLRWAFEPLPLGKLSALLLSPFFGSASAESSATADDGSMSDVFVMAEFDAFELHRLKLLRPELSLAAMIEVVEGSRRKRKLSSLLTRLRDMHRVAAREQMSSIAEGLVAPTQSYADWTDAFNRVLEAAGWKRMAARNLEAYQRWERVLDEMATLDFQGMQIDAKQAHGTLTHMLRNTIHSSNTNDAAIQILSPQELGGTTFDALWFLGADDLSWPAVPALNPLLSLQMQRTLGVPGADNASDLKRAQALTHRIAHSAEEVVFSFARHTDDGERRPSPLLQALGLAELLYVDRSLEQVPLSLTLVPDDQRLPLLPERVLRGGAQILQAQAACGFRAFAEWRLWSSQPEAPELGMNARERGSLVHLIMEQFWEQARDQPTLRAMPRATREALVNQCIAAALNKGKHATASAWDAAYLETQRRRLQDLLQPWLNLELERPEFQVRARESKTVGVAIGPLTLTVQVDRIDETAGGSLILDYKTGAANPVDWLSERPDAPQLPLYAVLAEAEHLGGVAFALLRAGEELGLKGFADDPAVLAKSSKMEAASLEEQVLEWRRILTRLAAAFAEGDVAVAPKCYPQTCKHCAQRILCRLDPASLGDYGDEEEELSFAAGLDG